MGSLTEKAVENHKKFYSCSASVLCAAAEETGLTEQEAKAAAAPFAGGRMVKCGAVLAAEYALAKKFGADCPQIKEFESSFMQKNKSLSCRELRGGLRSCRGCVTDAAEILESLIGDEG
ncbi:MAG: C-GCAxxG-C-C family protein [Ruminococcus sp.]|nr:C-GCAxxG-C-C family protein [Ruminococcus sp.]